MRLVLALSLLSATAAQAFEPGTHGEPLEETGYFAGCNAGESGTACEVHARGAIFMAYADGPSEIEAVKVLEGLTPGDPVRITGDMISMGDVTIDFALNTAEPNPGDPLAALVAGLQGAWKTDDGAEVVVTGLNWAETDGASYLISLGNGCSDGVDRGGLHLMLFEMGGDPFSSICLQVIETGESRAAFADVATGAEVNLSK